MLQLNRPTNFLKRLCGRCNRFLSSKSSGGENNNEGTVDVDKLLGFFKHAEEKVAKEAAEKAAKEAAEKAAKEAEMKLAKEAKENLAKEAAKHVVETAQMPSVKIEPAQHASKPQMSAAETTSQLPQKKDDGIRRFSTASRFVPWTSNRLLKEYTLSKSQVSQHSHKSKGFATLLRESTFVQLGNFNQREVVGVVIENANDSDLYVDFGGKFLAVVPQPENSFYPRGSLVRIRLRDFEMASRFMVNTKGITLLEADATLIGPYRGQLTQNADAEATSPSLRSNKDVLSVEHWKL